MGGMPERRLVCPSPATLRQERQISVARKLDCRGVWVSDVSIGVTSGGPFTSVYAFFLERNAGWNDGENVPRHEPHEENESSLEIRVSSAHAQQVRV
jgi:hypothetical protein